MSDTKVKPTADFEQAMNRLLIAAADFLLKAQDVNHEQQPEWARAYGKLILDGGQLGLKVVIGEPPLLECAVLYNGQWEPFLRWPATQPTQSTIPTSMVN